MKRDTRYLYAAIFCAALAIVAALFAGCTPEKTLYHVRTVLGIRVRPIDAATTRVVKTVDATWARVQECWHQIRDGNDLTIEIRDLCNPSNDKQWFTDRWGRDVRGYYTPQTMTITVCPDLGALEHEMHEHMVSLNYPEVGYNYDERHRDTTEKIIAAKRRECGK